jgi:hypothetical protein
MGTGTTIPQSVANLKPTAILDSESREIQAIAERLRGAGYTGRVFAQRAHVLLCELLRPVYSVNERQAASETLRRRQGSCSQRMACLEAVARAGGVPTRVRALYVKGSFWYPRFQLSRPFIPKKILLVWPQFFVGGTWLDFDELHSPIAKLAESFEKFTNEGESLFEAVRSVPVDFLGKTCGLACARAGQDLSAYVVSDLGFFDTRDEVFERFGSFQDTVRGRVFELLFGGRRSSRN